MISLIKRNMLLFFKDKTSVFFSFMAVFVVLGLYVCFLGDMMIQPLKQDFPDTARELSDTWIMAGTLGIVSLTTSLSVLGIIIEDKSRSILNDFYIAPISQMKVTGAYLLSTICITFLVSVVTLIIGELYIVAYGGSFLTLSALLKVLACMVLSILACTAMLFCIMSFFKSATSFSNVTTIIGTLSGFLMGIYVPVGALPKLLQTVISLFPPSHCAALFRNIMMDDVLTKTFQSIPPEHLTAFKKQFGLVYSYGGHTTNTLDHILIIAGMGLLFFLLQYVRQNRR